MRPFYFDGVLTVEAKLFHLVRPDVAVYGERDRQRIFLVRRMVRDLDFGIDVATVPTVRTDDGLPVSSRVALLDDADRRAAAALPRALEAAASNADLGVDACIAAAQSALMGEQRITLEYLSVVDPETFLPSTTGTAGARSRSSPPRSAVTASSTTPRSRCAEGPRAAGDSGAAEDDE